MTADKIIKVCGMREPENICSVIATGVDWMGLIFYPRSSRYVGEGSVELKEKFYHADRPIKKVGVFVDAPLEQMLEIANAYHLDYLQLHGNESPDTCYALQKRGFAVIKALPVATTTDLEVTRDYEDRVDYFLFDTQCEGYGGSGQSFDWRVLSAYEGETPFLLSGGLRPESLSALHQFTHPRFAGIDLNSGFEVAPANKDADALHHFITNYKKKDMNRIDHLFETKQNGILSVYFTAGYPKLEDTLPVLRELQAEGIDMVEVGIPFSDPMADGVVIQAAATQALNNGMSLKHLFAQLKDVRNEIHIPIVLMGYLNPIMQYGFENFCRSCKAVGVDGVIIPDLPYADYMADYKAVAEAYDIRVIMLITPETSEERIRLIDRNTSGFIYLVSSAATTGAQKSFDEQKQDYFRRINGMNLSTPRLVGFGISNKATYDAAAAHASGVIVGSRFIQLLASEPTPKAAVQMLLHDLGIK